jgi:hypothetical protein
MNEGWVLIVQNSVSETYQIFDGIPRPRDKTTWTQILLRVLAVGARLYGIPILV